VRPVIVDYEIARHLSDAAIIARWRKAIADMRSMVANSIDKIIEAKHLMRVITDDLISIKRR
jgi:hypothetical protein